MTRNEIRTLIRRHLDGASDLADADIPQEEWLLVKLVIERLRAVERAESDANKLTLEIEQLTEKRDHRVQVATANRIAAEAILTRWEE